MRFFGYSMRWMTVGAGLGLGASAAAQPLQPQSSLVQVAPVTPAAPLVPAAQLRTSAPVMLSGNAVITRIAADRALELGLTERAAQNFRELLAQPGTERAELTRGLATALLELGRPEEAEATLQALPEPRDSAWHLRAGLAAAQLKKIDAARAALDAIRPDDLTHADRAWWLFLQGNIADLGPQRNVSRANDFYVQAENAAANATSELARARLQLAGERFRLRSLDVPTPAMLQQWRSRYDNQLVTPAAAYENAMDYAIGLDLAGNSREAVTFLTGTVIPRLPTQELYWQDRFRLLVGLVGDRRREGEGRAALSQLLARGSFAEKQREALQLLAQSSTAEPERSLFRTELDRLIAATPRHAILDSLFFYRAQVGLAEGRYRDAEDNARKLIEQFPGSPLKVQALGVQATAAWEQSRFREAANFASQTRDAIDAGMPGPAGARLRAELGVLQAEAWYQAEDYRNAALAYATASREPPPGMKAGDLIFMRVLAEIRSGSGEAAKVIDEVAALPAFDVESRWQAEWSLARALSTQGDARAREALARVTQLLDRPDAGTVTPELRARMRWLQARLSLEAGQAERAIEQVNALIAAPEGVEAGLWKTIASSALLRRAQAEFALGREAAALETLRKVRADYAGAEAVAQSYLTEASYFEEKGQLVSAQRALTNLTDRAEFRNSEFFPYALYQFAVLAERLGQTNDLAEANRRIEDLVNNPPTGGRGAELVFAARLKQGEILRKLNEFPRAEQVYQRLINEPASEENLIIARLELARSHNAQATDPVHAEQAERYFSELTYRAAASPDVRVEAGFNFGLLLQSRNKPDEAAKVWWNDVITPFLIEETRTFEQDAKRPYWLARTLLYYGDLAAKRGHLDEARRAYALILERRISTPAEGPAREALARLGVASAK